MLRYQEITKLGLHVSQTANQCTYRLDHCITALTDHLHSMPQCGKHTLHGLRFIMVVMVIWRETFLPAFSLGVLAAAEGRQLAPPNKLGLT